jgi:hypothetical protein
MEHVFYYTPDELKALIAEEKATVVLVRGSGHDAAQVFAFVALERPQLEPFMQALKQPVFDPSDYGMVIIGGEGEPGPDLLALMEKEFQFTLEGALEARPLSS